MPLECERLKIQVQQTDIFRQILLTNLAAIKEVLTLVKANGVDCLHRTIADADYTTWRKQRHYNARVNNAQPLFGLADGEICDYYRSLYEYQNKHMFLMNEIYTDFTRALSDNAYELRESCAWVGEKGEELAALKHAYFDGDFAAINDFYELKRSFTDGCDASKLTGVGSCSGADTNDLIAGEYVLC